MNQLLDAKAPAIDLGIPEDARTRTADELGIVLADTYTLYLKTHHYHWNVTGPLFPTLHTLFETQYQEMWASVDVIAERIRALGSLAPGTYSDFSSRTTLAEDNDFPDADEMIRNLIDGHQTVARTIRPVLDHADEAGDQVTVDVLTQRLQFHEKTAWMLRALLE